MTQIARTILEQLGGNQFIVMTGAKEFVSLSDENKQPVGIQFRIPKSRQGINMVRVKLDHGTDTYDVEFLRVYGMSVTIKDQSSNIYCDQLAPIFEIATGLFTTLVRGSAA